MKFRTPHGMGPVVEQQQASRECYATAMKKPKSVCAINAKSEECHSIAPEASTDVDNIDMSVDQQICFRDALTVTRVLKLWSKCLRWPLWKEIREFHLSRSSAVPVLRLEKTTNVGTKLINDKK